ncbi:abortive infection system antitoxin AbiGi family protein [uncultured Neisseria sp.]|uniref:abortive infection system antitoxin AbiGi family protein n=1 Tax=uncultured Neisseria sp. TaxID=237778 RepID=UPI002618D743|nr:abortive infection system antitoxin AbiGi family protein [uncultured Neisseria sp.]
MATIKSNSLFHFTPKEEYLLDILENGFWPRYCSEDIEWLIPKDFKNELEKQEEDNFWETLTKELIKYNISSIAYPMSCFCDIPLSKITAHTDFYGGFGLGMTKEWGIRKRLNPIFYLSDNSIIPNLIQSFLLKTAPIDFWKSIQSEKTNQNTIIQLMKFLKPLRGKMKVNGKEVTKNFDEECEWRYAPASDENNLFPNFLPNFLANNNEELQDSNIVTKKVASLNFEPSDIKYIFVPEDSNIPTIINKINTIFTNHPEHERLLLLSKVISLDTIRKDF